MAKARRTRTAAPTKGRTVPKAKVKVKAKPAAPVKGKPKPTGKATMPARKTGAPRLLAGGNPQIAKADGDAPVQAYLAALPGWKQGVARRIDALVVRTVPGVRKAVKWNSPFYGGPAGGWFLALHAFTKAIKVTFFKGTALTTPPTGGTAKEARWIDIHEDDLDEARLGAWIREAAAIPGWGGT